MRKSKLAFTPRKHRIESLIYHRHWKRRRFDLSSLQFVDGLYKKDREHWVDYATGKKSTWLKENQERFSRTKEKEHWMVLLK